MVARLIDDLLEAWIDGETTHLDRALDCWRQSSLPTLLALARCSERLRQAAAPRLHQAEEQSAATICAHFGSTRAQLAAQQRIVWREGLPPAQRRHLGVWLLPGGPLAGVAEFRVPTASRTVRLTPLRSGATKWILGICGLDAELMSVLAIPIAVNASMTSLDLDWNEIGDAGAAAIANAIAVNASVTKLYLYDNKIGDEGAKALASALEVNASLKLKELVVPDGLEKNAQLVAACRAKGVKLV